jgi:hypothetical protein
MHASAVKYEWLGPLMVQKASDAEHVGYGGSGAVDSGVPTPSVRLPWPS